MTTKRIYRAKYLYRLTGDHISAGDERTARMLVEAYSVEGAAVAAGRLGRRACKTLGDEKFLRVVSVKEKGEVTRG